MTRVLLTRATADDPLGRALAEAGFEVVPAALTRTVVAPREDLARALDAITGTAETTTTAQRPKATRAAWAVLTSPTGVRVLAEAADPTLADHLAGTRVAAVGRATARVLAEHGVPVDLTPPPDRSDAAGLAAAFPAAPTAEPGTAGTISRVVLPGSALASPVLADGLAAKGWDVVRAATYTTATVDPATLGDGARLAALTEPWPDAVVVTSGSNARALVDLLGLPPTRVAVVAIGRPTQGALAELGIATAARAKEPAPEGIARATVKAIAQQRTHHPLEEDS